MMIMMMNRAQNDDEEI